MHETSQAEVKALCELSHENIIKLIQIGLDNRGGSGQCGLFLVLEYCAFDFRSLLDEVPLTSGQIKDLFQQLLRGVREIHRNNFIHRDIKPDNILIASNGRLKVADFGSAIKLEAKDQEKQHGCHMPTLWYRCPELMMSSKKLSPAVDIWSVGCTMAEVWLRGPLFFGFESDENQLGKIVSMCGHEGLQDCSDDPDELSKWKNLRTNYPCTTLKSKLYNLTGERAAVKKPANRIGTPLIIGDPSLLQDPSILRDPRIELLSDLLELSPMRRISAEEALRHEYFSTRPHPERLSLETSGKKSTSPPSRIGAGLSAASEFFGNLRRRLKIK